MEKFLPILLGTDANAYGMARSFYEEYKVKALSLGKMRLIETRNSNIVDVQIYEKLDTKEVFLPTLLRIGKEYKEKYEKLLLIACGDAYSELVIHYKKELQKYFIVPYIEQEMKEKLENKKDFYEICEKYNLDYPKTYIVTKETKDKIKLPFPYPVAIKASNSIEYVKAEFPHKKKGYKAETEQELKEIIEAIYASSYQEEIIIQEFIPGDDNKMWVLNCYSNKHGKVKMMCLGNCILEDYSPAGIGNYKAIISGENKKIYQKMQKFLEEINYIGYSNFDMKYDERDGKYKLFEINIRQGRSSFFATVAGCNLSRYIVEDYILEEDKKTVYNKNQILWLGTAKRIVKKYTDEKSKKQATELIKNKKYDYTLKNKKDNNLYRFIMINRVYFKDFGIFRKYFHKRGIEHE